MTLCLYVHSPAPPGGIAGFLTVCLQVRIAAMEAFASFFRSISKKSQPKFFQLVPDLLNVLPPLKESSESDELSAGFLALIELAEISPKMFKSVFNNLVKFSISVIADKDLSDQVRQNALELMATFADYSPNMCKKDPEFAQEMVTQCLSLMTDIGIDDDDASEWNASEDVSCPCPPCLTYSDLSSLILRRATSTMWLENSAWTVWQTSSVDRSSFPLPSLGSPG
ncbi:unnamed protein product [Aspergillus oryzae]|uniref:Unnamed protein product n=2 Tax=Aspergillus oryzae TaxID=5062 RepID=A0AAN4YCA7_ASPOZ|nr:unnamed protein product [Aspergillus oryzae]GMF89161.1 unnamed protein product [Aspergillus oryzae]GMG02922.1 unnamed protein product [Aspergillus oryzae]GMG25780.1 unnamed protein product [Aspergillus oryzae]GMG48873.1 unnamed protein product [Aspergillus oryzae var. brunneus]